MICRSRILVVVLPLVLLAARASADPAAEQLYQEGREAARLKNWPVACARFRASHDREPAPGTLLNLADCEEHQGKLVDALAHFEAAGRSFKAGDERVGYARQRATGLTNKVPKLTVRIDASSAPETSVELDGAPLTGLGSALPVDPGEHVLMVRAPQRLSARSSLRLAEGESRVLDVAAGPAAGSQGEAEGAPPEAVKATSFGASSTAGPDAASPWRTAAYVSVGVGAAALVLGVIGGVMTINAKSTADANCQPGCNSDGLDAESRGKTWNAIATGAFIVAGAGLAAGAGLLLFAPRKGAGRVSAQPTAGGAALRWMGSF